MASWSSNPRFQNQQHTNDQGNRRINISDLQLGLHNSQIVGIIVGKEGAKAIPSKRDPSNTVFCVSFTVRDSLQDMINSTCWGSQHYIEGLAEILQVGDVIMIENARIVTKASNDEKYRPTTNTQFCLVINENHSKISPYSAYDARNLNELVHLPTKQEGDYYTLQDIHYNGQALLSEHVNLLAVVRSVTPAKEIITRDGRKIMRCVVKLADETCPSFPMNLWGSEHVEISRNWSKTVLFITDCKVSYDEFRKSTVVIADNKTLFTVNPKTREAQDLYSFAQTLSSSTGPEDDSPIDIDLANITQVYSIAQIKEKQENLSDISNGDFYGIFYGFITQFNIDSDISEYSTVIYRCGKCRHRMSGGGGVCENRECSAVGDMSEQTQAIAQYDVPISLSDATGSLSTRVRFADHVLQEMLGCPAEAFQFLPEEQKTALKWKFLLERRKIYFKCNQPTYDQSVSFLRIVSCSSISPLEFGHALSSFY